MLKKQMEWDLKILKQIQYATDIGLYVTKNCNCQIYEIFVLKWLNFVIFSNKCSTPLTLVSYEELQL